ncbi:MAG: DUF3119 family protein [Prochlorococcaceae cyanobacterium]
MTSDPASLTDGPDPAQGVILAPRYGVPLTIVLLGAALLPLQGVWSWAVLPAGLVALFGLLLLLQTVQLRLLFAASALLVGRGRSCIRRFPYDAWLGWRLFWPWLPVLFYFREQRTPHLLPMLFDAGALEEQLRLRLPALAPSASASGS